MNASPYTTEYIKAGCPAENDSYAILAVAQSHSKLGRHVVGWGRANDLSVKRLAYHPLVFGIRQ